VDRDDREVAWPMCSDDGMRASSTPGEPPTPDPTGTRALIFDLGQVLVDWDPRHLYDRLITDPVRRETFLTTVCPPSWNTSLDAGTELAAAVRERSAQFPEWTPEIEAYVEQWPAMLGGLLPGIERLIDELLDRGVPLYALSNWSHETFPLALQRFPMLTSTFADIVISGEIGLVKPDPAIFSYALNRFGRSAAECLFIDDNAANVAGAALVGLPAVRFTGVDDLREHPTIRHLLDAER
jgi:2-haloacid dehalogenase